MCLTRSAQEIRLSQMYRALKAFAKSVNATKSFSRGSSSGRQGLKEENLGGLSQVGLEQRTWREGGSF